MKTMKILGLILVFGLFSQLGQAQTSNVDDSQLAELKVKSNICCEHTLKSSLKGVDGVESVSVCKKSNTATINYQSSKTDNESILAALTDAGHVDKSEADKVAKSSKEKKCDKEKKCSKKEKAKSCNPG